jgi:hypothetical protein
MVIETEYLPAFRLTAHSRSLGQARPENFIVLPFKKALSRTKYCFNAIWLCPPKIVQANQPIFTLEPQQ